MYQKNVALTSLINWLRSPIKDSIGLFFWDALQKISSLIKYVIAWSSRNGNQILLGVDPMLNLNQLDLLPPNVVSLLNDKGFKFLKDIYQNEKRYLWTWQWRSVEQVQLPVEYNPL